MRCGCWRRPACGRSSFPIWPTARTTSSRVRTRSGALLQKTDPFGVAFEVPPLSAAVVKDISGLSVGRRSVDVGPAPARRLDRSADVDLRGPSRLVGARSGGGQSFPDLPRDGAPPGGVREGNRLHAHRAAAGHGASVFRLVGLPGARFFCADQPLRSAGGLQVLRRRLPSGRPGGHSRLGAGTLSRRTNTGWRDSTARRCSSTPIRARASIRTGAR